MSIRGSLMILLCSRCRCSHRQRLRAVPRPEGASGDRAGRARVELAWTAVSGATSYAVYRGTSASSDHHRPDAVRRHRHVVQRHDRGQRHDVLLRRPRRERPTRVGELAGRPGDAEGAPRAPTGNAARGRELLPGRHDLARRRTPSPFTGGIEGFATAQSVDGGQIRRPQGQRRRRLDVPASRSTAAATTAARARASSRRSADMPAPASPAASARRPPA